MIYYVIETQKRKNDGVVNILNPVQRNSFASALSYYYERCSKMVVSDLYSSVSILLVDENLNVKEKYNINHEESNEE